MSKTILLADDSVTIRKVVELTFMEEDYELVSLGGGDEAVSQLAATDPDLVIADVHMPGVSGYEVCRRAKELRPERPVLLLVGTFEPFDEEELEASGADRHLKKPFDSQELLQTVRDLLAAADEIEAASGAEAASAEQGEDEPAGERAAPVVTLPDGGAPAAAGIADEPALAAAPRVEAVEQGDARPAAGSAVEAEAGDNGEPALSDEAVERIARRVAELLGPEALRDVAWEVVPDLAEVVIKERLRELESQVE